MRTIISANPVMCLLTMVQGQSNNNQTYNLLIGTYTTSPKATVLMFMISTARPEL